MLVFISFGPRARRPKRSGFFFWKPKPRFPGIKGQQRRKLKKDLEKARAKFRRNYDGLLIYMNKMAIVATLEGIGIKKVPRNRKLIQSVLDIATADFKNLIETSTELTPKHKIALLRSWGQSLAKSSWRKFRRTEPQYSP